MPNPVCPVVKDFLLNSLSEAMCKPVRLTDAPIILVFNAPALISPLAVPVTFPPPACVITTASGSLPIFSLKSVASSYPRDSTPAIP
jgi:hypothetical protein